MSERETRDFMSVDSFSQLPFIRATPALGEKPPVSNSGIRLFGIEFPKEPETPPCESKDSSTPIVATAIMDSSVSNGAAGGEVGGRKFECHYCCRNFPTSQALGGHQNAHKRERQHAKRAHLHSVMAAHHRHDAIAKGHAYGLLGGYHRLGVVPPTPRFGLDHAFESLPGTSPYTAWSGTTIPSTAATPWFYNGPGSLSQPINGSPLPRIWSMPMDMHTSATGVGFMHRDRLLDSHRLAGESGVISVGGIVDSSSNSQHGRHVYEPTQGVKDGVSLDLRL